MIRLLTALALTAALAQPLLAQSPAPTPPMATAPADGDLVKQVRAAIAEDNFEQAEQIVTRAWRTTGMTGEAIEAFSWLGRGALAGDMLDRAEQYAMRTNTIVDEWLMTHKLDDEPHVPLALGAAIEVQALVAAKRGQRADAVRYLEREADTYKDTSIVQRIRKNLNLLSLEGQPALPLDRSEWIGAEPPVLTDLKGKPVLLYMWAHWCPDCKRQGPILETLMKKYGKDGLTIVAPTQRYGYVAGRQPAEPAEELAHITQVRDESYPWLAKMSVPMSAANFTTYGVSSTPTLVLIGRDGNVAMYHPGQMTLAELDAAIKPAMAKTSR